MIKTFSFHSPLSATQVKKLWLLSFIFFFFSRVVYPLSARLSLGIIWSEVLVLSLLLLKNRIDLYSVTLMCFYYPA